MATPLFQDNALAGQHILVTGASSGIGQASAIAFSQAGAKVTLMARNQDRLNETLGQLSGDGHHTLAVDLQDIDGLPKLLQAAAAEHGLYSGLFHCAGQALIKPVKLLKPDEILAQSTISFGAFLMLVKGITHRKVRMEGPMSLVAMSSVAGHRGQMGMALYSGIRASLDASVKSLAVELAPNDIRVNSLVGGAIETPMHSSITAPLGEASVNAYEQRHLLGFGQVSDVSAAAIYLLSTASRWVTGTNMVVDGGYLCH